MNQLPIFLNIKDRKCVVVGGGKVAFRKASLLCRASAKLHVIAESICTELQNLCDVNDAVVERQPVSPEILGKLLKDAVLIIAATDAPSVNEAVSQAATKSGVPVNVVDQPELSSFLMPSIVDRSPVLIAISSGGSSPILTRKLKELNEIMIPARIDKLAELLASYRQQVKDRISDFSQRVLFWEDLIEGDVPELVYAGNEAEAVDRIEQRLKEANSKAGTEKRQGEVYLVGAGPGDPDLLTLRALRLMHKADVVLYDRLVSEEIMSKLRPDAERINVGKERAKHLVEQETINQMLVRLAREGKKVLRLKGGDPFIFGRGGEEIETLSQAGIPFQIVPGITAASGCAAYAGIPLTHRDYSQSVRFLTGHVRDGNVLLDWDLLVKEQQTLVFYMGLSGLNIICQELLAHGMNGSTPCAIIQQGTTRNQKVVVAELSTMSDRAAAEELKAPTIIIIGEVVRLRDSLSWYKGG